MKSATPPPPQHTHFLWSLSVYQNCVIVLYPNKILKLLIINKPKSTLLVHRNAMMVLLSSDVDTYFYNAYCTHQNECTVLTDNTTVYLFSEDSCSNLSSKIELIDLCAVMDKAICLSIKTHNTLVIPFIYYTFFDDRTDQFCVRPAVYKKL